MVQNRSFGLTQICRSQPDRQEVEAPYRTLGGVCFVGVICADVFLGLFLLSDMMSDFLFLNILHPLSGFNVKLVSSGFFCFGAGF